jgi:acetyltransferase-like isoleucine patch superfamily enzyme
MNIESTIGSGSNRQSLSISSKLKKYPFLVTLLIVRDILAARAWTSICTAKTKFILTALGCHYGRNLKVDGKFVIRIHRRGAIQLGENVRIRSRFMSNLAGIMNPTVFHCIGEGSITFGDHSGCSGAILSSRSGIVIGKYVNIGANVRIFDHDYHAIDFLARRNAESDKAGCRAEPILIGDDVFIGTNAIILKGVTIGDRSVIGAGTVVSLKQIPPDSLVAGNPAKIVGRMGAKVQDVKSNLQ